MLRLRSLWIVAALSSSAACSSSSSSPSSPPAPVWTDAPATVDVYEGRVTEIPLTVRARDPKAVRLEPASSDGITIEPVVADEAAADGLFHARLVVRSGYGLASPEARVDIVEGETRSSVSLPLRVHALSWKPNEWASGAGPQTREHGVFVVDADARTAFLVHGSGYSPQWVPIADAWRLDLTTSAWSPWTPTGDELPALAAMRVASVPGTKVSYVHGGYTGWGATEVSRGELYRIDLGSGDRQVTRLTSNGDGNPRYLHAMAYDTKGEQLVVFGGIARTPRQQMFADTWLVKVAGDTATWTKLDTANGKAPSERYGFFHALDEPSRRLVVWSGAQIPKSNGDLVNAANDAWALDLAADPPAWTKLAPAGEAPPGRRNGCVMHDPIGRRLFVYGGTSDARTTFDGLWVLSLEPGREEWTKLDLAGSPPVRSSGFGFATPDGGVACAFGNDNAPYADVNLLGYFD